MISPSDTSHRTFNHAKTAVIGLGASGEAAALLLRQQGAEVWGLDANAQIDAARAQKLAGHGVHLKLGEAEWPALVRFDLIVISPGVSTSSDIQEAERRGVRIVSELEFASWYVDADIIAVGGTNGKSTTTELAALLCKSTKKPVFIGGNYGTPLSDAVVNKDPGVQAGGIAVVEVSSFQLERVAGFRPKASILLNITEDHLDRYPSFEAYAVAKGGAFRSQTPHDVAIVPYGDELCARIASLGGGNLEWVDGPSPASIGLEKNTIVDRIANVQMPLESFHLAGRHNVTNLCAAWAAARAMGANPIHFEPILKDFHALAHRTEYIAEINGVRCYDDSKGTNVGASVAALNGLHENSVVLIAGGRDKGGSYEPLMRALGKKGRALVVLGEAASIIEQAAKEWAQSLPVVHAQSMEEAVKVSVQLAKSGDAVLLSPACSSFDMFRDYKHRGEVFAHEVRKLSLP